MHRLVAFLGLISLVLTACTSSARPNWTFTPASGPAHVAGASGAPGAEPSQGDSLGTIAIEAFDLGFTPAEASVETAGTYDVEFRNTGAIGHDLTFADGTQLVAAAGETAHGTVAVPEGGLSFICSVPGHEQAGMKGMVAVGAGASHGGGDDHGGPLPVGDVAPDPDAPAYTPYDATAPARLPGEVHDIDLVISEQDMTVAPGYVQRVWTFGGTVPGPVIRVKVGDRIRVHLKNPVENQLPHSIDFHASQVAWNDEMTSIEPGQEKLYEWTADYAGVWMYHCGTSPALHHLANGMYGMVIVEPREGLPRVDKEFAIVQSEWYLGAQGQPADLDKAMAAAPAPDMVLFNGVANQYKDHPLQVGTGERVRVFVLNAGPSVDSSFHVVGTIFDTVVKEGVSLVRGNTGSWGAQAVDLAPAQGAIIEFTTAEDGLYPMVTHAFNFVGRGALGLFQAGDGDPLN
ncbi:MAG TPA: multicopper oxidase domain-containing protein [Candidatus Limnocylindrales bacterium]